MIVLIYIVVDVVVVVVDFNMSMRYDCTHIYSQLWMLLLERVLDFQQIIMPCILQRFFF